MFLIRYKNVEVVTAAVSSSLESCAQYWLGLVLFIFVIIFIRLVTFSWKNCLYFGFEQLIRSSIAFIFKRRNNFISSKNFKWFLWIFVDIYTIKFAFAEDFLNFFIVIINIAQCETNWRVLAVLLVYRAYF